MKLIKTIHYLVIILLIAGCGEDKLDVEPSTETPLEEAIKTESGLRDVKNGIYLDLSEVEALGRNIIIAGDLLSDDAFINSANFNKLLRLDRMTYSQELSAFDEGEPINRLYDVIVTANTVINATLQETSAVKQIKAEALVGRALALFYAVNLYSPGVTSGINQEYGVPVYLDSYDPKARYPRSSVTEVYSQIEKDLLRSLSLFQEEPNHKSYFTPTAAKLLLSRVYLFQNKWQQAYTYALEVETNHPFIYQFVEKENYVSYFSIDNAPETVFELGYSFSNSLGVNSIASFYDSEGAFVQNEFRESLVSLYNESDVRKKLFLFDEFNQGKNEERGYYIAKYSKLDNYSGNVRVLRMSEAKLNKIEALYHLGNHSQALVELNSFAATRGSHMYKSTGAQLLTDILNERRLEFAGEGYRFFDLKRNRLPIIKDSNCIINCNVAAANKLFVLPMPQIEMSNNPKMVQYPGY